MRAFIFFTFLLINDQLFAGGDGLISERPGQALSPVCLGAGKVQIQSGLNRNDFNNNKLSGSIFNTVLRIGLGEKFELNTNIDYDVFNNMTLVPYIGFKGALLNLEKNQLSLQYNSFLNNFYNSPYTTSLKLIASHTISQKTGFSWNTGLDYIPENEYLALNYVASFSVNPSSKIGIVLENYGNYNHELNTYFDVGIGYLVTPVFQIDTYFGGGMNNGQDEYFINAGFTYRIDYKD